MVPLDERIRAGVRTIGAAGGSVGRRGAKIGRKHARKIAIARVLMLTGASLEGRVIYEVGELLIGDRLYRTLHKDALKSSAVQAALRIIRNGAQFRSVVEIGDGSLQRLIDRDGSERQRTERPA